MGKGRDRVSQAQLPRLLNPSPSKKEAVRGLDGKGLRTKTKRSEV